MRKYVRLFVLAVLAGAAIGIGGIVFLSLENKIVGALMFTAGLYSICVHGLNLFTGKVGYAVEQPKSYIIDLVIIWVGNLAGTWHFAFFCQQLTNSGAAAAKFSFYCYILVLHPTRLPSYAAL